MINVPIAVKDALREGTYPKNYHIDVLNDDETIDFSFDNSNIVSESVKIDERLCSEDEIKFGLCEGSSLEFQYFGLPSIQNRRIKVTLEVDYGQDEPYAIPMGYFAVGSVPRQASTGILKVTAYNKLMSKYLDEKANENILNISPDSYNDNTVSISTINAGLLNGYKIRESQVTLPANTEVGGIPQIESTVELLDESGTYKLIVYSHAASAKYDIPHSGMTINVEGAAAYSEYVSRAMNGLREWIIGNIKNGETLWNNTIKNKCLVYCFDVFFADGTTRKDCTYVPSEFITSNTITEQIPSTGRNLTFYVRPLEGLYKLIKPLGSLIIIGTNLGSLQTSIITDAQIIRTSSNEVVKEWHFGEQDNFIDMLPKLYVANDLDGIDSTTVIPSELPDVTLRELQSAVYETMCQFGQLDRLTDLFAGTELNQSKLLPQDTLYPSNELYPSGAPLSASKSMYSQLWANENNVHKWRYLIITYKGLDENQNEVEKVLQRTIDEHGTENYNCSDNWLFRNLIWTEQDIGAYADAMVAKMQDITWFPFEMWCAGLPYLETGDQIEIPLDETTYTSYVLQRTLNGIQNLQDTYINGQLDIF